MSDFGYQSVLFGNAREDDAGATYATRDDGKSVSELIAHGQTLGQAITGIDIGNFSAFKPLVGAAYNSTLVDQLMVSEANRSTQYYDGVNQAIYDKSGVTIPNPNRDGFSMESTRLQQQRARELFAAQNRGEDPSPDLLEDPAKTLWDKRVADAVRQRPELADVVGAAKIQFDPFLSSRAAREEFQMRQADAGLVPGIAAGLLGGFGATMRSPVDASVMAFGGGAGTAATALGRMAQVIVREAAINGLVTLLAQPMIQELANLSGEPSGFWEAVKQVGVATVFGGVFGAGAQGFREFRGLGLPPKIQGDVEAVVRSLSGQATPAEFDRAAKALDLKLDDATRREFDALVRSIEIERTAEIPPAGVTPDAHNTTLAAAIRHAEDPTQAINPAPLPRPDGADDAAIRAAMPPSGDPVETITALRADTRLALAAATSDSPDLAILGRLALMDERAADMALTGVLPAEQVALVGGLLGEPAEQLGALQALIRLRAAHLEEVAQRAREEAAAQRIVEATRHNLPTPEQIDHIAPETAPGALPAAKAGDAGVGTPADQAGVPGAAAARAEPPPGESFALLQDQGRLSEIVNPIDPHAPPDEQLRQIKSLTDENQPIVEKLIKEIDAEFGAESKSSVKEPAKILEKASRPSILDRKPWHAIEHVRDTFRFKTVVDDVTDVEKIVRKLEDQGIEIVKRDVNKVLNPEVWGWRIASFDLRMPNGQLVEFYLPVRELEVAKDAGHVLFEKWRNTNYNTLSLEQRAAYDKDVAASNALYQSAWDAYLARTGASESDIRASLTKAATSPGSEIGAKSSLIEPTVAAEGRQAPPGERMAASVPDSVVSATTTSPEPSLASQASGGGALDARLGGDATEASIRDLGTKALERQPEAVRQAVAHPEAVQPFTPETAPPPTPNNPAGIFTFKASELRVDADRFQFKADANAEGVSTRLAGVTEWDPNKAGMLTVWQARDGTLYVADGHQRTGLARRLEAEGKAQNIELGGLLYRETDGFSPADVRALAASKNIAEGTGTALDVARVLRDRPELMNGSLPLTAGQARQGANLAKLGDEAFRMIVNKVIPENYGAIVGELGLDPAHQVEAIRQLAAHEPRNVAEATYIVQRTREAELQRAADASQTNLFQELTSPESTVGEEMRIAGKVQAELAKDKSLFGRVLANQARIEETGSKIARSEAETLVSESAMAAELMRSGAITAGPVRDALKEAATNVKNKSQSLADATRDVLAAVRREAERDGAARPGGGGARSPVSEPTPAGEQGLIPGVAPITTADRLAADAARPLTGGAEPPGGLFDDAALAQRDIFDSPAAKATPAATPSGEPRMLTPDEFKAELDRPAHLSDAVKSCKE